MTRLQQFDSKSLSIESISILSSIYTLDLLDEEYYANYENEGRLWALLGEASRRD